MPPLSHESEAAAAPVDLAHLVRQTFGDRGLEREALTLFLRFAATQMAQIRSAANPRARSEAAHALLGSALGIGATSVARLAREIETASSPGPDSIARLAAAVEEARRFIAARLAA